MTPMPRNNARSDSDTSRRREETATTIDIKHRAEQARIEQQHPQVLAGELAGQDLVSRVEQPPRPSANSAAVSSIRVPGPHDQQHADEACGNEAQRGRVIRSCSSHPAISVTRIGLV